MKCRALNKVTEEKHGKRVYTLDSAQPPLFLRVVTVVMLVFSLSLYFNTYYKEFNNGAVGKQ